MDQLTKICDQNEIKAAQNSLDAELIIGETVRK